MAAPKGFQRITVIRRRKFGKDRKIKESKEFTYQTFDRFAEITLLLVCLDLSFNV
jgi:hypothetical protein